MDGFGFGHREGPDGMPIELKAADVVSLLEAQAPEFSTGAATIETCSERWTRKKLRKCFWEFEVRYQAAEGSADPVMSIIVKQYAKDRSGHSFHALAWLYARGFSPPSPFLVPRPLAYNAACQVLVQEKAPGTELASTFLADTSALAPRSRLAAQWLAKLHSCDGNSFRRPRSSAVWSIQRRRTELAEACPELAPRLDRICSRLIARVRGAEQQSAVPTHGDYHPKNILMDGEQVTAIDFDHFALREPAVDVGYFVGQMAIMTYLKLGSFSAALPAVEAFLATYTDSVASAVPWERVATHVSRTFVQSLHYELCVLRNQRTDLIDRWLSQAEAWLESTVPGDVSLPLAEPQRPLSTILKTVAG